MKNLLRVILLLAFAQTAFAAKKNNYWNKLDLTSGMRTEVVDSEVVKARVFGFHFGIEYEKNLDQNLNFNLEALAILETGSNDVNGAIAEWEPNESIQLMGGGISYTPWNWLKLDLGAINQGVYYSPLFLDRIPFAGAVQKIDFGSLYFRFQQSVPNNNNLRRRIGSVDTGTPTLLTETFGFQLGSKNKFNFEATHFAFKDLSNAVAENSRVMGNSTTGTGLGSEFLYEFDGVNLNIGTSWVLNSMQLEIGGQYIYNDSAPDERNTGSLGYFGLRSNSLGFTFESFRNESDSSVAFYNAREYGHNNVSGSALTLELQSKGFQTSARLAQTTPIEDNGVQKEATIFMFQVVQLLSL